MALEGIPIWLLIAAAAGGAFGAAVGALQSFTLAGIVVIIGEVYALAHRTLASGPLPVNLTGDVAFGVVLGPHIAFGGGAAAAAYAAKRGYMDVDFAYHDAKEITTGLGSKPDVLLVGAIFGVVGFAIAAVTLAIGLPTDPVALGVVLSAIGHRLAFGYDLIGAAPARLFDMSPFERGEPAGVSADGGRLAVEPWLPYQYRFSPVIGLGAVVGVLSGYLAYLTGSAFLAFGVTVAALAFLIAGAAKIPVTHHMALPASTAVLASVDTTNVLTPSVVAANIGLDEAVLLGLGFGVLGAILGEIAQRIFYAHADTHLDPPAVSIVLTSAIIGGLAILGVFPQSVWIPLP